MAKSKKKLTAINYTSRDFDSIKLELVNYAKRYYADSFKDFNEAGFGAMMLDSVAYIGDILSFYLDYQTNESFLDTALEYDNVVRIARQLGYKYRDSNSSAGQAQFYVTIPADGAGVPDSNYFPTLRAGSQFTSGGGQLFTLTNDVYFGADNNEIIVSKVNSTTGVPTEFAVKATGTVISGKSEIQTETIVDFEKFLTFDIADPSVTEIISVTDSEGHEYFEVDHLAQEIVFKAIRNNNVDKATVPAILKALPVPRRFVLEKTRNRAFLQFGYGSDSELTNQSIVDPSAITLKRHGRDYYTQQEFDPTNLTATDKFGVAPSNTVLTIIYRVNDAGDANIASNTLKTVSYPILEFEAQNSLDPSLQNRVNNSLEVNNEEPILGDIELPSVDEIKQRVFSFYAAQNRAVTVQDYKAIVYAMPPSFGAVKRCAIERDFDSFKRNLNLYVISENTTGILVETNTTIKNNLKTWLANYKIINDTIDILNARIVNFGIDFKIVTDYSENKFNALEAATLSLRNYFANNTFDIGEAIFVTDIYKELQKVPNVIDVLDVKFIAKTEGGAYSRTSFDFNAHLSNDGRYVMGDPDTVFEIKFPDRDVQGSVV